MLMLALALINNLENNYTIMKLTDHCDIKLNKTPICGCKKWPP